MEQERPTMLGDPQGYNGPKPPHDGPGKLLTLSPGNTTTSGWKAKAWNGLKKAAGMWLESCGMLLGGPFVASYRVFTGKSQAHGSPAKNTDFVLWFGAGLWAFAAIAIVTTLTGGFLPALGMGIYATWVWAGAIGLGVTGLFALINAMRSGVDFPDQKNRSFKEHLKYLARWLLPALLLTPIIVLSAGVIPAIGAAASTTVFKSVAAYLGMAGYSVWVQLGVMAGSVFAGLSAMQLLGTLSMAISTRFSKEDYPKSRAFFRHFAKGLHLSGFLSVFALAFSNLAIFAAVKMGLMAAPVAGVPAVGGTIAAAAAPVAASTSWMTALPIMAGVYTAISTGLSALYGAVMAQWDHWAKHKGAKEYPPIDRDSSKLDRSGDVVGSFGNVPGTHPPAPAAAAAANQNRGVAVIAKPVSQQAHGTGWQAAGGVVDDDQDAGLASMFGQTARQDGPTDKLASWVDGGQQGAAANFASMFSTTVRQDSGSSEEYDNSSTTAAQHS